jgi:hypothetical protein
MVVEPVEHTVNRDVVMDNRDIPPWAEALNNLFVDAIENGPGVPASKLVELVRIDAFVRALYERCPNLDIPMQVVIERLKFNAGLYDTHLVPMPDGSLGLYGGGTRDH